MASVVSPKTLRIDGVDVNLVLSEVGGWHVGCQAARDVLEAVRYAENRGWVARRTHYMPQEPNGVPAYELTDYGLEQIKRSRGEFAFGEAVKMRNWYRESARKHLEAGVVPPQPVLASDGSMDAAEWDDTQKVKPVYSCPLMGIAPADEGTDFVTILSQLTEYVQNERVRVYNAGADDERTKCQEVHDAIWQTACLGNYDEFLIRKYVGFALAELIVEKRQGFEALQESKSDPKP